MPGFYYFLPVQKSRLIDEKAGKLIMAEPCMFQMDYLFDGRVEYPDQVIAVQCAGPGGIDGTLLYPKPFSPRETLPKCVYDESSQSWVKFRGYWIGRDNDASLPGPEQFARPMQMSGYSVDDLHGDSWTVPVVRSSSGRSSLPQEFGFDSEGNFQSRRRSQYDDMWEMAGDAIDYLLGRKQLSDEQINRMVIAVLAANYYFGVGEVFALAHWGKLLLETKFVAYVIGSITDWSVVTEFAEKKTENQLV